MSVGRTTILRPERLVVQADESGDRYIVGQFADGEEVVLVLAEAAAKEVGRGLVSPAIAIAGADALAGLPKL